jgi:NAD(P)-dependent dehydrogenase (short-subunit alcohol dehydrogenase family)
MHAPYNHVTVNYFGLVRCCKAFLPIFKRQINTNCRIINLTSIAGLIHGHQTWSGYMASKHAANAFSHVLRAESRAYVQVTTVNPSFHATAIVHNLQSVAEAVWTKLDDETRKQYGQGQCALLWNGTMLCCFFFFFSCSPVSPKRYILITARAR